MSAGGITIVCFDLGGVVVRICRDWVEGCAVAGIDVREPERYNVPHLKERRRALIHAHQIGEIHSDEYFRGIASNTDGLYTAEEIQRVHHAWLLDEYTGVLELVDQLNAQASVRTVCLSNTNPYHWDNGLLDASRYPAIQALHERHASHEMRCAKPDSNIYRMLESRESVTSEQIVFFDDTEENITAARSHGWSAHRIDPVGDTTAQMRAALVQEGVLSAR